MAEETKTVSFKLQPDYVHRLRFSYKDKTELFRKFQKKLEKLGLSMDQLYWSDWDNDRGVIRTADDLLAAVENGNQRMYYRTPKGAENFFLPNLDNEEEEEIEAEAEEKKDNDENEDDARSRSPPRHRSRSRSCRETRPRFAPPPYGAIPWNFAPYAYWNYMMDPRFGPMPYPPCPPTPSEKKRRHRRERSCSWDRLNEEFGCM